jgi:hypothetical protein
MMALVVAGLTLLLVADGAVVMPEEKEEGTWSDAGSTTRSAATATAAAEEGVVMTEDVQEIPSSRHYDFAAAAGEGTEDGSRIHELTTPIRADAAATDAAATDAAAATTQRRRKIAKKTHEVLSTGSGSTCSPTGSGSTCPSKCCPPTTTSGYRILMTATSKFTCTAAGRNQYWEKWSAEMFNRPHSTLTKGTSGTKKYGWAAKGSSTNLNAIDTKIGEIANGIYAGKGPNNRYKMHGLTVDMGGSHSSLALGKYNSTSINEVSKQIFYHLNRLSSIKSQTPQYKHSPGLHFTLGYISDYTSKEKFTNIAACIKGKEMDLVIQNIDNRCWCKIHSLNNRQKK